MPSFSFIGRFKSQPSKLQESLLSKEEQTENDNPILPEADSAKQSSSLRMNLFGPSSAEKASLQGHDTKPEVPSAAFAERHSSAAADQKHPSGFTAADIPQPYDLVEAKENSTRNSKQSAIDPSLQKPLDRYYSRRKY